MYELVMEQDEIWNFAFVRRRGSPRHTRNPLKEDTKASLEDKLPEPWAKQAPTVPLRHPWAVQEYQKTSSVGSEAERRQVEVVPLVDPYPKDRYGRFVDPYGRPVDPYGRPVDPYGGPWPEHLYYERPPGTDPRRHVMSPDHFSHVMPPTSVPAQPPPTSDPSQPPPPPIVVPSQPPAASVVSEQPPTSFPSQLPPMDVPSQVAPASSLGIGSRRRRSGISLQESIQNDTSEPVEVWWQFIAGSKLEKAVDGVVGLCMLPPGETASQEFVGVDAGLDMVAEGLEYHWICVKKSTDHPPQSICKEKWPQFIQGQRLDYRVTDIMRQGRPHTTDTAPWMRLKHVFEEEKQSPFELLERTVSASNVSHLIRDKVAPGVAWELRDIKIEHFITVIVMMVSVMLASIGFKIQRFQRLQEPLMEP